MVGRAVLLRRWVGANGLHAVPPEYHRPDVEDVADESLGRNPNTFRTRGTTASNPFFVDSSTDEEDEPAVSALLAVSLPRTDSMQSSGRAPRPPTFGAGPVNPAVSALLAVSLPRTDSMQSSGRAPTPPTFAAGPVNPVSNSPQRQKPKGILLGTWKRSGVHAAHANAVYGSRDVRNRINRRIAKVDMGDVVVQDGAYDIKKTACSHTDIEYLPRFAGMTKSEVDSLIQPLLQAMEQQPTRRSQSPAAQAAARRAARAQQPQGTASSTFGGASTGFQTRGATFFVSEDGQAYKMKH